MIGRQLQVERGKNAGVAIKYIWQASATDWSWKSRRRPVGPRQTSRDPKDVRNRRIRPALLNDERMQTAGRDLPERRVDEHSSHAGGAQQPAQTVTGEHRRPDRFTVDRRSQQLHLQSAGVRREPSVTQLSGRVEEWTAHAADGLGSGRCIKRGACFQQQDTISAEQASQHARGYGLVAQRHQETKQERVRAADATERLTQSADGPAADQR